MQSNKIIDDFESVVFDRHSDKESMISMAQSDLFEAWRQAEEKRIIHEIIEFITKD